ncbi:unnamed protein product [Haemonchus placei]|uniref:Biogenesis of lysosome-related organelles complex 1 subunit 2 n=1 Tax=Haemonchus placei TaxID=6290 RepID=A0A0N4X540_HAEPC|nr:unnamed protein product [Haemonchus placei]
MLFSEDFLEISIDPVFCSDCVREEIEFFDEIIGSMGSEMTNADIQISNEYHRDGYAESKDVFAAFQRSMGASMAGLQRNIEASWADLRKSVEASMADLQEEITKQEARVTELVEKIYASKGDVKEVRA